ncbi:MAG TPA: allantoicase [Vicinamibacterales bacterium]
MNSTFLDLIDLASERLGAAAIDANDEFFAPKDSLVKPSAPEWREGEYTDRGKWMDGWETRRRRDVAADSHDWCVIRLGVRGIVRGVDVETTHFKGNFPESCAIDLGDGSTWSEAVRRTPLVGHDHNLIAVPSGAPATHLRLRIYPDGGVARLRAYGEVVADWDRLRRRGEVDLAAAEHGGLVVACSDMFFGSRHNLIMPGDATHMGDGWETKRRRGPGHDWTIIRLATPGAIRRVEVDTRHFKGNAPGACSLEGSIGGPEPAAWRELLPRRPILAHARQTFEDDVCDLGQVSHVRFNIFPDGGVGRLRLFGAPGK